MTNENQYRILTGCYGATRGTTVAAIAEETVRNLTRGNMKVGNLEIVIEGVGCPSPIFMPDNKVNHPVKPEWAEAIYHWLDELKIPGAEKVKHILENKGRQRATKEQLERADKVYAADAFILGEYAKAEGKGTSKYQTMLQGADLRHPKFGISMDDIEFSDDATNRIVIAKRMTGKVIGDPDPKNAKYYDLSGKEYVAGSKEALMAHSRDVVEIGVRIGYRTYMEACVRAGVKPEIKQEAQ